MARGSSSFSPPPWVTTATWGANPSTWSASSLEQAHRDQQREVDVLVSGGLDPIVERALGVLPDRVAVGLDDHRALRGAVLGHLGPSNDLDVPRGKVVLLRWQLVGAHRSTEC